MAHAPEGYGSTHYGALDQEKLRKKTARELVYAFANRNGELRHVRFRRDERAKVLHVTLWWREGLEEHVENSAERLLGALRAWVWDGWRVEMRASEEPAPDVVFDPYSEKWVPRKAYAPLGTPGRVRRSG